MAKTTKNTDLVPVSNDNTLNELFDIIETGEQPKYLSYLPGLFTTASLP